MNPPIHLHIGDQHTTVATGSGPGSAFVLAMGAQKTAADYFKHTPPTPAEMEAAIMAVEDELNRARQLVAGHTALLTTSTAVRDIALRAGVPDQPRMELSLEAVERQFDLLAAYLQGRPASSAGIPTDPAFAATLLILREFMHHLQFAAISVEG